MAKVQIKSEKLTPFGGIFSIMEQFDSMLSPVIDSTLGQRCCSDSLLVETMLKYGTLDDFRELMIVLTPKRVADVFFSATERQIKNYYPEVRHFFSLVLKKYASRDTE